MGLLAQQWMTEADITLLIMITVLSPADYPFHTLHSTRSSPHKHKALAHTLKPTQTQSVNWGIGNIANCQHEEDGVWEKEAGLVITPHPYLTIAANNAYIAEIFNNK